MLELRCFYLYAPRRTREEHMDYQEFVAKLGEKALAAAMELDLRLQDKTGTTSSKTALIALSELRRLLETECGIVETHEKRPKISPELFRFFLQVLSNILGKSIGEIAGSLETVENFWALIKVHKRNLDLERYATREKSWQFQMALAKTFCLAIHRQAILESEHGRQMQAF